MYLVSLEIDMSYPKKCYVLCIALNIPIDLLLVRDAQVPLADLSVLVHLVGALLARLGPLQRNLLEHQRRPPLQRPPLRHRRQRRLELDLGEDSLVVHYTWNRPKRCTFSTELLLFPPIF